jgi:predicted ATPase/Tfp pilus assembly protein PilF
VGIGGVGKTRLALQVGYEERYNFRDGVFYVPLAALDVPEQLGAALARALNFSLHTGQNPWQELRAYLRPKELLLILDNFEHLLPGAGRISELLQYAPEVVVLVTSRERLSVQGEWVVPVTGMRYPRTEDLTPSEAHGAVRLFLEGARRLRPGFEPTPEELRAIVRICRLVEGLPLALELAAPWLRVLSCQEIVQEIERDIDFLEGARQDLPDRHRSLRAVFDHSWQLLSPPEQQVFKHLAVFRGAFSREAAEAVAGATPALLAALEDQSLLQIETHSGGTSRYDLHDLVQRYAAEKLARDPVGELTLRERHAEYYLTWVAQQRASLKGRGQKESVAALERELAQIRAAWSYATQSGIPELLRPALESLFLFYDLQSRFPEGVALFRAACDLFAQEGEEGEDLGFGLACQGWFVACSTDLAQGRDLLEEALSLLSKGDPRLRAFTLDHLGSILLELSEYEEAEEACEEALSLYQALDDAYGEVQTLNALGQMMYLQGECERARAYCEEGLRQAEAIGLSRTIGDGLRQMGTLLYFMGNHTEAQAYYEQALVRYRESRNRWGESSTLVSLAGVTSRQGDHVAAQTYLQEALQIAREIGDRSNEGDILNSLGLQCTYEGELDRALRFQEQALTIKEELGERMGEGHVLNNLTNTLWLLGQFEGARACAERALKIQQEIGYRRGEGFTLLALGTLAWHEGQPIEAREWSLAALNIAREINERFIEARALLHLGRAFQALGEFEAAEECYREAMALHQTLRRKHTAWLPLVELVGLLHEEGRLEEAQAAVDEILAYLTEHPIEEVTDEPSEIYLPCYRVLQTRGDPRARKVLREAYEELQQRAARIGRSDLRRAFLEKVPGNRAIVEAYEALMESEKRGAGTPRTPTESQPA